VVVVAVEAKCRHGAVVDEPRTRDDGLAQAAIGPESDPSVRRAHDAGAVVAAGLQRRVGDDGRAVDPQAREPLPGPARDDEHVVAVLDDELEVGGAPDRREREPPALRCDPPLAGRIHEQDRDEPVL